MTPQPRSPQMARLMASYGVLTERELVKAIRDAWSFETGSRFTLRDAEAILDQELEATYQRMQAEDSYHCPVCGWSRVRLDGETMADAQAAHEAADIHWINALPIPKHQAQTTIEEGQEMAVCRVCGKDLDGRAGVGWVHASGRRGLR